MAYPQDFLTARELGVLLMRSLAMSKVHQKKILLVADLQKIHICVIFLTYKIGHKVLQCYTMLLIQIYDIVLTQMYESSFFTIKT